MLHQLFDFQFESFISQRPMVKQAKRPSFAVATLSVLACLFLSMPAQAAEKCKLLIMGDSLSAAYGLPVEHGWVALMEARMTKKFPACQLVNASVSGETTAGGKSRLPKLLEQHQPTLMVLELGANDGLRGLPIFVMKQNLIDMIKLAKQHNAETVLVGMQIPANYGPRYTRKFKETFETVAQANNLALVPFMLDGFATDPAAFQEDGIHPNSGSQPKILENIWPFVEPKLNQLH